MAGDWWVWLLVAIGAGAILLAVLVTLHFSMKERGLTKKMVEMDGRGYPIPSLSISEDSRATSLHPSARPIVIFGKKPSLLQVIQPIDRDSWKKSLSFKDYAVQYEEVRDCDLTPCGSRTVSEPQSPFVTPYKELDTLLDSRLGLQCFWEFLRKSMSAENLYFYRDVCQALSTRPYEPKLILRLHNTYFRDDAPNMVTLNGDSRLAICDLIIGMTQTGIISDELIAALRKCQSDMYLIMKIELLPRFLAHESSRPWKEHLERERVHTRTESLLAV